MTDERIEAAMTAYKNRTSITQHEGCMGDIYSIVRNEYEAMKAALETADKVRPKAMKPDDWNKCLDRAVETYENLTSDKRTRMMQQGDEVVVMVLALY